MDALDSMDTSYQRRPLVRLFSDLWRESTALIRNEAELAKAEISEKVFAVGTGIASLAVSGAVLFAGFLLVLFAIVSGLAQVLPEQQAPWLAPLIVGATVLVVGWLLLASGRDQLKTESLNPSRIGRSVRRDAVVVKEHIK
jgi:formate hydrogenlyase subunit 3/multisubunit Na+/H+ antiporter MnhD subunit